jgi:hypothetical protein
MRHLPARMEPNAHLLRKTRSVNWARHPARADNGRVAKVLDVNGVRIRKVMVNTDTHSVCSTRRSGREQPCHQAGLVRRSFLF